MPSGSRPARLIETPSPVDRTEVYARVFCQFTDWGRETLPCSPSASYTFRAAVRMGPHCIGPNTLLLAANFRNPSLPSR